MKLLFKIMLCCAVVGLLACKEREEHKAPATGKPYDIFVVMPEAEWKGELGDTLRSILLEEVPMLNQREPRFDLYHIVPGNYKGLLLQHRNLLTLNVSPSVGEPAMVAEYDVDAVPQLRVTLQGPSDSTVLAYVDANREALQRIFEMAERDRFVNKGKAFPEKSINRLIEEKFGFTMSIPMGYTVRKEAPNFLWISYEMPLASQGIFIYSYPLTSGANFTVPYLVEKRNEFAALIPGPTDGSRMTTSQEIEPVLNTVIINGRLWFEMRGFWDVTGDYMGGPFVSYTTVDATRKEMVTIDGYVYSPKHGKRNYIRQLESLIFNVEFPTDTTASVRVPVVNPQP